jgi:hypothetical protein
MKKISSLLALLVLAGTLSATVSSISAKSFDGPIPDCNPFVDKNCGVPPAR